MKQFEDMKKEELIEALNEKDKAIIGYELKELNWKEENKILQKRLAEAVAGMEDIDKKRKIAKVDAKAYSSAFEEKAAELIKVKEEMRMLEVKHGKLVERNSELVKRIDDADYKLHKYAAAIKVVNMGLDRIKLINHGVRGMEDSIAAFNYVVFGNWFRMVKYLFIARTNYKWDWFESKLDVTLFSMSLSSEIAGDVAQKLAQLKAEQEAQLKAEQEKEDE